MLLPAEREAEAGMTNSHDVPLDNPEPPVRWCDLRVTFRSRGRLLARLEG
jgi:hypothetical protein